MRVQRTPLHQATILNVNVPDLPYEALKGYQATRLGFRHRSERIVRVGRSARPAGVLGRACGRRAGRGRGHRLPRRRERLRFGDAAADRPDAPLDARRHARRGCRDAKREAADHERQAAQSRRHRHDVGAHARASHAALARAGHRRTRKCSIRFATCRDTCSSTKRSRRARTRTRRCRSATARRFRSRSSWRA